MRRGQMGRLWILSAATCLLLLGCGDSNVFEGHSDSSGKAAKLERGVAALDGEDWDEAIRIFEGMDDTDPEVMKYLASAYVGKAGFDTLALVDRISEAEDGSEDIIYDSVTEIFDDDGEGVIGSAALGEKMDLLEASLAVYGITVERVGARSAPAVDRTGLTDQQIFQTGLYAAVHAVLSVVEQLHEPGDPHTLFLTLDELRLHASVIDTVTVPASFDDDLVLVRAAVLVLDPALLGVDGDSSNDIAAELNIFLTEVGYLPDETVSDAELQAYLTSLL